jgi:hypothetical protein
MTFPVRRLRVPFVSRTYLKFESGKTGNMLRGGFGAALRDTATRSVYERIFEPTAEAGPSGFRDLPRPFVFRVSELDGRTFGAGRPFSIVMNLFDPDATKPVVQALIRQFGEPTGDVEVEDIDIDLEAAEAGVEHAVVRFVTPTELKAEGQLVERPEFAVLAARIRDRVSSLRATYGEGPLDMDFTGFGERARAITMARCDVSHVDLERRSGRTGQVHPIGGFTGEAEYQGALGEFMPFLRAGGYCGVGRQTVWGNGEIRLV